jgi:23S rRNA (uracil1939-C5)-methyltransferase
MAKRAQFNPFAHVAQKTSFKRDRIGTVVKVTIERLSDHGEGIAFLDGKTLFVPFALAGEEVEVRIVEEDKQVLRAKVLHRNPHTDAPERVQPVCAHYQQCGGCQLQHLSGPAQAEFKQARLSQWVQQTLPKYTGPIEWIGGPTLSYRRRARIFAQKDKQNQVRVGYKTACGHQIIDIEHCPVMSEDLVKGYEQLRQQIESKKEFLQPRKVYEYALAASQGEWAYQGLGERRERSSRVQLCYSVKGLQLNFSAEDFIQVNDAMNQRMIDTALHWLELQAEDAVLDLFCGLGNFTLPIAQSVARVTGVEGVAEQVEQAKRNAAQAGLTQVDFIRGDLFKPLTEQGWYKTGHYTKVLMDPGRAGAFELVKQMHKIKPSILVYVSCNPATLARDLGPLTEQGYRVEKIAALDVFPQTHHLEMMVKLIHRG